MRRKVIQLGTNSLLVSLPSSWVKNHGIRKGDEVEVNETQSSITVTSSQTAKRNRTLALADNPELAARQINIAYKRGIDELEVQYENPKAYAAALEQLKNLIGFEVVESGKRRAIIKNIATGDAGDFTTVLRRAFLTLIEMSESAEECAAKNSKEAAGHLKVAEFNIDRLTDFCKRLLNKQGMDDTAATTMNYGILKDIERMADHYAALAESKTPRNAASILGESRAQLRVLYELYYSFDHAKAGRYIEKAKQLEESAKPLLKSKNPLAAHHIMGIIRLLNEMSWAVCARSVQ